MGPATVTESDIIKLDELWGPEGTRDIGLMLHQAPDRIIVLLARHPWDSVTLHGIIDDERQRRNL